MDDIVCHNQAYHGRFRWHLVPIHRVGKRPRGAVRLLNGVELPIIR
jgi:hypothetical protein